ncbi:hypothetical protein FEZ41_04575 [Lentilactobacillus parafarraginis]|jgi:GH25 family lysozyme M1 (1,4-beta-N-acetylmuramidase)|uniref:DUF5776 domain-containing protein n=2 Tax=Lentilactobacillus parafarraginis TaxID=390842 RepID=A0A0R1YEU8_9LACO|nr:DUF5776 domain-containing protein [Lentilactobacillus parafarraginis]KRM37436.1 hypothetical protein FD47_GL000634 [Lentilactobacillus parafarraginis DSM 18390 = JCM 14109]MCC6100521.1 DUF5776 domain-containing protein [Lactobacillus sp.]TLQ20142.1 hypothetical protein FEZ41_04575 [Lentilactobacillus parafarraginis]
MTSYFNDVAVWQPHDLAYFKRLKAYGSRGVVVKSSQGGYGGTPYINSVGKLQVINAKRAGLKVALYHYGTFNSLRYGQADPASEAKLMANTAKAWGLGKDTLMVLDAEDSSLRTKASADAALFFNELKRQGFHSFDIYGPGSWFWAGRLKIGTSYKLGGWPASYGSSSSGVSGAKAWQYTDNWKGLGVDGSLDYGGQYTTKSAEPEQKPEPKLTKQNVDDYYYTYNPKRVIVKRTIYQHKNNQLGSQANRGRKLKPGTAIDIASVHFSSDKVPVPYFKLANGTYITANRWFVNNAYYELSNLKTIKVIKPTYLYRDLHRTKVVKRSGFKSNKWPKGTLFDVKKVIHWQGGFVLKLTNGFYCTAYKKYVKKIK